MQGACLETFFSFSNINNTFILFYFIFFFGRCFINWVGIPTRISSDICSVILNMILRSRRKEPKEKKEEDIDDQLNISMESKVILTVLMKMMIWTFLWLDPKTEAAGILLPVVEGIIKLQWRTMPNYEKKGPTINISKSMVEWFDIRNLYKTNLSK